MYAICNLICVKKNLTPLHLRYQGDSKYMKGCCLSKKWEWNHLKKRQCKLLIYIALVRNGLYKTCHHPFKSVVSYVQYFERAFQLLWAVKIASKFWLWFCFEISRLQRVCACRRGVRACKVGINNSQLAKIFSNCISIVSSFENARDSWKFCSTICKHCSIQHP